MASVTGNTTNANPNKPEYIKDEALRAEVNAKLDEMVNIAIQAKRGNPGAEANYHRAAADLMEMRPAVDLAAAKRQDTNARHLRHLAQQIERGLLPLGMKLDVHSAA